MLHAGGGFRNQFCLVLYVCVSGHADHCLCGADVLGYEYILTFPILSITSTFPLPFLGGRNLYYPLEVKLELQV